MIYRYLYPLHGGGWWRRYWQYRFQIVGLEWRASDGKPLPPLTLFDYQRPTDQADADEAAVGAVSRDGWRVSDDRVIGGFSTSSKLLVRTSSCWERHVESNDTDVNASDSFDVDATLTRPFLRWYGHLDTTVGLTSKVQRSGFCALRSPEFAWDGANLRGLYNSLEIVCRDTSHATRPNESTEQEIADKRVYTVNLKVSSSIPEDIYQGQISPDPVDDTNDPPNFQTFVLPFDEFRLTARGRDREFHRQLDDNVKIESIGFVLMDGVNGSFQFDVARIRAVNRLDDGSVYEDTTRHPSSVPL